MYMPINYSCINALAGTSSPSTIKAYNNRSFAFWERALFQRACSTMQFTLPWDGKIKDFFIYCLFRFGFVGISENDKYGQYFQPGTLSGFDFYYQPTKFLISNPDYSAELKIGKECELFKLTPDYMGIWDIITFYAAQLSELDNAINISLVNNKFSFILGARNKQAAQAIKKALDKINAGEPAVVYDMNLLNDDTDKDQPWQVWERGNIKDTYFTPQQLQDRQTLLNGFDAEIGIPTIPYNKKERMVQSEAESRQYDAVSRVTVWLNTMKGSIEDIKKLYPDLNINVELKYDIKKELDPVGGVANVME